MKNDMIKLKAHNNEMWNLMEDYSDNIAEYWETREKTMLISKLMAQSLGIILCQLMVKKEEYKKYPATVYSEEDFVDMVVDMMVNKCPSIKETKAYEDYIDCTRKILWGHIKIRSDRIGEILQANHNPETSKDFVLTDDDMVILNETLMVVYMECLLRKTEAHILGMTYGE